MKQENDSLKVSLEKKVLTLETYVEFSHALNNARTLDQVYDLVMRTSMGFKGIQVTALLLAHGSIVGLFRIETIKGVDKNIAGADVVFQPLTMEMFNKQKTVTVKEVETHESPEIREMLASLNTDLMVPIIYQDMIIGILSCSPKLSNKSYTEEDIGFLQLINRLSGIAINNILNLNYLKESNTILERKLLDLNAVEEINRYLSSSLNLEDVCHSLLLTVTGHITAETGLFYLYKPENGQFDLVCQTGFDKDGPDATVISDAIINHFGQRSFIENNIDLPRELSSIFKDINCQICIPVRQSNQILGLCYFGEKATGQPYAEYELELAALLVGQAVSPLKNSMLHRQITENNKSLQDAYESLKTEITVRQSAEKKAFESERSFRSIVETANEGFWKQDPEGITVDVNPELCKILGDTRENIIGQPGFRYLDETNARIIRQQRKLRKEGIQSSYEATFNRKDGSLVHCLINATPIMDESGPKKRFLGSFSMLTDISKRKHAEDNMREYARIVSLSSDMMALTDKDGMVKKINNACLKGFGKEESLVLGQSFARLFDPKKAEMIRMKLDECLKGQDVHFRLWLEFPDEDRRFIDIAFFPYLENGGTISGTIMIMRDMTQVKSLEDRLQISQKMEAIGTMAGGIAHDFNNILSGIFGFTQLARRKLPEGHKARKYLDRVFQAANRAADLVKQILTVSRQSIQEKHPVQISLIVKEVSKLVRASLPSTIDIQQDISSDSPLVYADPTQIHQVLMNLCTNAAFAMKKAGGQMSLSLAAVNLDQQTIKSSLEPDIEPGVYQKLSVGDSGHGIDAETQKRIFDPFFTTKEMGEGTGLGLAVTHGIVKSHGGAISVNSEPGMGATFDVYLPVMKNEKRIEESNKHIQSLDGTEHILLVEDEIDIMESVKESLELLGYKVTARENGLTALEEFEHHPDDFDLIVTDQTMPKMTGISLAEEILKIQPDIPVILCSGLPKDVTQEKLEAAGIRAHLIKPFKDNNLPKMMRSVLDGHD